MSDIDQDARRRRRPRPMQVVGELFLTLGVLLLLFAFYEAFWTNVASGRMQDETNQALEERWSGQGSGYVNPRGLGTPELGDAFARMYVPAFGSDWSFALLEGSDDQTLLAGPGRYTDTQLPGQAGNFALAGHRVGMGAPFNDLGGLEACDAVVVETQTSWITYRVLPTGVVGGDRAAAAAACFAPEQTRKITDGVYAHVEGLHITLPTDVGVLSPVPNSDVAAGAGSLEQLITLTTCHPQFSNAERMIVHAMAVETQPKTGGVRPAALNER